MLLNALACVFVSTVQTAHTSAEQAEIVSACMLTSERALQERQCGWEEGGWTDR